MDSCSFKNNSALKGLFNLENVYLNIKNITFENNRDRIFVGLNFLMEINQLSVFDHKCDDMNSEGCIIYVEIQSSLNISDITLKTIKSNCSNDLFYIKSSKIYINNISLENIQTVSLTLMLYGKDSIAIIRNSRVNDGNKSLIYLEGSKLSIENCYFYKFNNIFSGLSIIECDGCLQVFLMKNYFQECFAEKGGSFSLSSGFHKL